MTQHLATLLTCVLALVIHSIESAPSDAADDINAQATSVGGSEQGTPRLVRRYVPQFVGKREPSVNVEENANNSDMSESQELSETDLNENDFIEFLKQELGNEPQESLSDINDYEELNEGADEDTVADSIEHEEDKRYVPSFVGKRYVPEFEGKRYQPMFVGKRYQPMFVGKRYQPTFVGKRYQPMFVGKRYQPTFVGKRYQPMFVGKRFSADLEGKRYQPMFVGKRYQPHFVGKRYQPMFVGKRYIPNFVGKRYVPSFVGKRYIPSFVGKRYQPMFVGKRYQPKFVGKKDNTDMVENTATADETPMLLGKRSTEHSSTTIPESDKPTIRHKRSVMGLNDNGGFGRYFQIPDKRFVAPEFVGRRDSISSILSALKVLQYARSEPRLASKRFQAPLFIGKRDSPDASDALFWYKNDMSPLTEYSYNDLAALGGYH